ncbi:MAG: cytochrome c biogenesis protein DipZ [Candidatus Moraniibacteriota bacterium]|nr:MAG: cytochrome c biogenesis protein DipZ [Candidatus Moranbacteria bacterium]
MILLVLFAFAAGVVTVLSPCILPVLPIILSSGIGGVSVGKSRPIGVVVGFVSSFTLFTLFLSAIVNALGVSADTLRLLSVIVIAGFGFSLLVPRVQLFLEGLTSKFTRFVPTASSESGFLSGLLIGFSLGLLWTPCVGPILASVITLAVTGAVSFSAFILTLAYSAGAALPMFLVMWGGRALLQRVPWLLSHGATIQRAFGVIMVLTAFAILVNADRKFQTFILTVFPNYGSGLTSFEDKGFIQSELGKLRGDQSTEENSSTNMTGKPLFDLQPKGVPAPEIIPGGVWINSKPLSLKELRGKVVLVDFWTYSCINCQRTLPYLRAWNEKYADKGLVIIGVHAPEFEFEKNADNVRKAVADFGLTYPVVQDNDFATWQAYGNHYWPAKYFIDAGGNIRYHHFGEGGYDESEHVIQELLREAGEQNVPESTDNPSYTVSAKTPESYVGYARLDRFISPEPVRHDAASTYTAPAKIPSDKLAFSGEWNVSGEYATPSAGSALLFSVDAQDVFLVMRPKTAGSPARVRVLLDGMAQDFGADNQDGIITVNADRLYHLIHLSIPGRHLLRLEFEDGNADVYAFTFG